MKNKGIADNYQPKTGLYKHREWRGFKDTMYDFFMWLQLWGILLAWVLKHPIQNIKALFRYRWMYTYLTVPAFFDRIMSQMRGAGLRGARNNMNTLAKIVTQHLTILFSADEHLHPNSKKAKEKSDHIILIDELLPGIIGAGFKG